MLKLGKLVCADAEPKTTLPRIQGVPPLERTNRIGGVPPKSSKVPPMQQNKGRAENHQSSITPYAVRKFSPSTIRIQKSPIINRPLSIPTSAT